MNKRIASEIAVGVILLIAVIVGGIFWLQSKKEEAVVQVPVVDVQKSAVKTPIGDKGVMCTQEAKLCEDGKTYVSRTQPNCEFAACPAVSTDETANWQTYKNEKYGFEFQYPKNWLLENSTYSNNYGIGLADPNNAKRINDLRNKEAAGFNWAYNVDVLTFDSMDKLDGVKSSNIDDYIKKNNIQYGILHDPQKLTLAGRDAYSFIATGLVDKYTVITDSEGVIYEVVFNKDSKESLSLEEGKILSTFKFTK